jgi:hypothetical protein
VPRFAGEQLAAVVEDAVRAPAGGRHLLRDHDLQAARPGALHAGGVDPGQLLDRARTALEVDRDQAGAAHPRLDGLLDVHRRDALEAALHRDALDRLVERPDHDRDAGAEDREAGHRRRDPPPVDRRQAPARLALLASVLRLAVPNSIGPPLRPAAGERRRTKLVSSTRQHRVSKSMPTARAAIGTRLWSVMPGTVLISSSSGRPVRSVMKSTRPQPGAGGGERALRERRQVRLGLGRQARGAVVARVVAEVLRLVVVEGVRASRCGSRAAPALQDRRPCIRRR